MKDYMYMVTNNKKVPYESFVYVVSPRVRDVAFHPTG